MKVLFAVNPKSGQKDGKDFLNLIDEHAKQHQYEYLFHPIEQDNEEILIKEEIESYKPDIVAAAGGDGTVNLLSKILVNTAVSLLIIPLGSANGMAKELGLAAKPEASLDLIVRGEKKAIDLLKINGNICVHLADVGLNARIVKRFEEDPKRGLMTYAKYLYREVFLIKKYRFYIRYDGKEISEKAVSITFANASKYGTGAVINPTGKINDGKFELVIIKPFPRIHLLSISWKIFTGTLQTSEFVEVISCSEALIWSPKKTTLNIDGEIIGKIREIKIEILPGALKVLVPQNLPA